MKSKQVKRIIPFVALGLLLSWMTYDFILTWSDPEVDVFDHHNFLGYLIPAIYLLLGYLIIYFPRSKAKAEENEWPRLRCLLMVLLFMFPTASYPLCGPAVVRAHITLHLALMMLFLIRWAIAEYRHERNEHWRYYCLVFLYSPILPVFIW